MQQRLQRLWRSKDEQWQFFRQWLRHPLSTAAISPSGPHLARSMVAEIQIGARRVIELGAGTGAMTRAILAQGIEPDDLLALELNPDLCRYLEGAFPQVKVICADARELAKALDACGYAQGGLADAVVSSLGLLSMPRTLQHDILKASFDCLNPGGRFIQFTYGPTCPVPRDVLDALDLHVLRGRTVLRNVPPATVFVFSRNRSRAIVPRSIR
ncbi:methyltransferase domain-containing protein [Xanthomonadaceae bacterium JHOS43]|nr:methyltransferase domain-containing protein [Xanthomonadaceae bacterium JHOS43]MCX7563509.1 methyltransferase domain-containing protein [Xanthomonadaceae bacterium XH05]